MGYTMGFKKLRATTEFTSWLDRLSDVNGRARIQARIQRLASGNPGKYRRLKFGVCELKVDSGPGYRVYYTVMKTRIQNYDVAKHLRTPEEMAAYLEASIAECDGDPAFVAHALGDIARAKGMARVARDTGLGRESLYKALSANGNPQLGTILKVAKALGLEFGVKPVA